MSKSDWREVTRLRSAAIARGQGAAEAVAASWASWDRGHLEAPRLIARLEGKAVGWAALAPVSPLPAYSGVADVRIHVDHLAKRCGIGRRLLTRLVSEAEACGVWSLQTTIVGDDGSGLYFHRRCGFRVVGVRERVAFVNGEWRSALLMERRSKVVGQDIPPKSEQTGDETPELAAAWEEAIRVLAPLFLDIAADHLERAKVLGIDADELSERYRRRERSPDEDDRLVAKIQAEQVERRVRERQQRWDDEVREEIARRKREGLPYEHILKYFD